MDSQEVLPVTLVVPVRDEARSVTRLLDSIRRQTVAPAEVLLVDGGSSDGTSERLRGLTDSDDTIRVILAGPATPGRGRNVGIEAASTEWIALTDAGIDVDDHWLERLFRVASSDLLPDVVYGSYEPSRRSYFERAAELAYVGATAATEAGPIRSESIASCLLKKDVWLRVGGFPDLRAAEDRIFMRRIREEGFRVGFAPEARITWDVQPDVRRTFARFRSYSRHNVLAGEQANWHYGVARQYVAAAIVGAAALVIRRPAVLAILPIGLVARVMRTLVRRREGRTWWWVARPDRVACVGGILLLLDAATFVGWAEGLADLRKARRA